MKVIVSVINDLTTDQRVNRVCVTLHSMGFKVQLVGRKQKHSTPLVPRRYYTHRMSLFFEKGPLFYATFQMRLFWYLLFQKADLLVANDLDTLLPNFLISKIKRIPLVYDTHELFCEVPELQANPFKRKLWKRLERFLFPKLKTVFTVNESIAGIYQKEYGVPLHVIRNIPMSTFSNTSVPAVSRKDLGLPENKKIILLQGAGINMDRGAEEAVRAMEYVEGAILLLIGDGDVISALRDLVQTRHLEDKVKFIPRLPFAELAQYTRLADLGLTLDKDTNINYRYSLPNKLFDYLHAGIPVLASDLVEVRKIVEEYRIGRIVFSHDPVVLAEAMRSCLQDEHQMELWKENTKLAIRTLCWEEEEKLLRAVYTGLLQQQKK